MESEAAQRARFRAVLYDSLAGGEAAIRDASPLTALTRLTERGLRSAVDDARAVAAIGELGAIAGQDDLEAALDAARARYDTPERFRDAIYFTRCLDRDAATALRLLNARSYVEQAAVPTPFADLHTDAGAVHDATTFETLWKEPPRLDWMLATSDIWRRDYVSTYVARHGAFNAAVAALAERMDETSPAAGALERLNGLRRLGPALGVAALVQFHDLERLFACAMEGPGLVEALAVAPVCPECAYRLGDAAPAAEARRVAQSVQRGLAGQQTRLAQRVVSRLLGRPLDGAEGHLARFIQVVQASDLASLIVVLDDPLVEFLRALLEAPDQEPGVLDRLALSYPEVNAANLDAAVAEFRRLVQAELSRGDGRLRLARADDPP